MTASGVRDIAVTARPHRRRSATSGAATPARPSTAAGFTSSPASSTRQVHFREPGLEHKEDLETGSRAAVAGRRHRACSRCPTPSRRPRSAESAGRQGRRAPVTACSATSPSSSAARARMSINCRSSSGFPAAPASRCSWAPPPATCWSRTTTASAAILARIARRAAFHGEDEYRLAERALTPASHGDPLEPPGLARRGGGAACRTERLLAPRPRRRQAHACAAFSTAEEMALLAANKDVATVEVTPHHLTLVAPDAYRAPRHARRR